MDKKIEIPSMGLVKKYDKRGSFYTDYPALGLWERGFSDKEYRESLNKLIDSGKNHPLFFYLHFPFCPKQCFYCMCFSEISQSPEKTKEFLRYINKEINMLKDFFDERGYKPFFKKVHLGGGSPSIMNKEEFDIMHEQLKKIIDFSKVEDYAIEIDPRTVNPEMMKYYHKKGIDRVSFGIQEFDLNVQKAINRVQSVELIESLMTPEIRKLFKGVNFDIIYGLPRQTIESFKKTIKEIIRLSPDRMGVCILGWRPDIFKHQRFIKEEELPSLEETNTMNFEATQMLVDAGYERIGLDHFVKPGEELSKAKKEGALHRNSMAYNPGDCIFSIALGPSGMSRMLNYYFQKEYDLSKYYSLLDAGKFPVFRGYKLSKDLIIRREIMEHIVNYDKVDFKKFEDKYDINFKEYFQVDLASMVGLINDGIVVLYDDSLQVTQIGKFFHRHVCAAFDIILRSGVGYKHARDTA